MRVGVFDSGIGGVNVLSCIRQKYPNIDYVYFGDTKNLPYGDKTKEELLILARESIKFLINKKVDMIIIACGTISSTCYKELKDEFNLPIYDIISPTIEYLENNAYLEIGVIGTNRTIESNVFALSDKNVLMKATPSFVPIIENNLINEKKEDIIKELSVFRNSDILVLGCTHYPLLKSITNEMNINTLDMGEVLMNKLELTNEGNGTCELYFSLLNDNLTHNVNNILKDNYQIYKK